MKLDKHNPTQEERMFDIFLVLGSQYYTYARYSSEHFYFPISVTLFHHAIEMLLKGFLSRSKTSAELKMSGHDLVVLWELFKSTTGNDKLGKYDITISRLNRVELLRYPDTMVNKGIALNVSLGHPASPMNLPGTEGFPQFFIDVSKLDAITSEIFKACNVDLNDYFKKAPPGLEEALPMIRRSLE